ncbi:hypothetical protein [Kitasatospora sp. NPDC088346]|uniref:hypothetical protein n=1 Tax=Kitasatospora sp. NPDC088346 TaxID=3364073 RepID=UPI0037FA50C9
MAGPRDGWGDAPPAAWLGSRVNTPFFTRRTVQKNASFDGTWRPPVYGPHECSKPEY